MNTDYTTHTITWQDIPVTIRYNSTWPIAGHTVHLAIESANKARLPMTETGYKSHFVSPAEIETYGTAKAYVHAWLNEASHSDDWCEYVASQRQGCLF